MKKLNPIIAITLAFVVVCMASLYADEFDEMKRSLDDSQRSMKMQRQQQLQQNKINLQQFKTQDSLTKDKAVAKNEELLKKFIESQNRDLGEEIDEWLAKFSQKYHLIIEVLAVAIFITTLSVFLYKQKIKKMQQEGKDDKSQRPYHHPSYRG